VCRQVIRSYTVSAPSKLCPSELESLAPEQCRDEFERARKESGLETFDVVFLAVSSLYLLYAI
jgi:hypothetical protein